MSNYIKETKHPKTGEWQDAEWLDNYFGHHHYGVRFSNGDVFDAAVTNLETRDSPTPQNDELWTSLSARVLRDDEYYNPKTHRIIVVSQHDGFTDHIVIDVSKAEAILAAKLVEARIDELKNWRARTLLEANGALNIRVEMEARIAELQGLGEQHE